MLRLCRFIVATVVVGLVATTAAAIQLGLVGIIVVTSGVSMNPAYHEGDLVVIADDEPYATGQIVAYRDHVHDLLVLHRIVGGDSSGYELKGDNNQSIDAVHPRQADLLGRAVLHVPRAGTWLRRLTSPTGLGLIAFGLVAGGGTVAQTRRRKKRGTVSRHTRRTGTTSARSSMPPQLMSAATAAAGVGLLGAVLGLLAWTGPTSRVSSAESTSDREVTFSYTARVAKSPAYDGTTVSSPDPVFRTLARRVAVHYAYAGAPGSVVVDAELTSSSGWRSTVRLAQRTTFGHSPYEGTGWLDLPALEARAQQAATVIGAPTDQVTVTVRPRFRTADGAVFAPELALALDPLRLALVDDAAALHVTDPAQVRTATTKPRTLGLLDRTMTVATARIVSLVLLVGALLAAGLVALLARATMAGSEGAAIRRRYAAILVRVHPMPTPAGRPVVEVTRFATLAKLAERYGLLVLHWSRSDVETFVVQDEGTTYRYRTGGDASPGASPAETFVVASDVLPDARTRAPFQR